MEEGRWRIVKEGGWRIIQEGRKDGEIRRKEGWGIMEEGRWRIMKGRGIENDEGRRR